MEGLREGEVSCVREGGGGCVKVRRGGGVGGCLCVWEGGGGCEKGWRCWGGGGDLCVKTPICVQARVRQHASALERKKQRNWSAAQGNSLKNDKFDYAEMAVTTSSMSTPTNDNGESPFSRDSLGDTVIHLDKVRGVGVLRQSSL